MGKLPRGFKADCERSSEEVRRELGLTLTDPLDPFLFADLLGVPVWAVSQAKKIGFPPSVIDVLILDRTGFSALTVGYGQRREILYNDSHSASRVASDVTHELSHIYLRHPLHPAMGLGGGRNWIDGVEEEAVWHSGSLLVPRDGAYILLKRGMNMLEAAGHMGVSEQLFQWRAQMTGVIKVLGLTRTG